MDVKENYEMLYDHYGKQLYRTIYTYLKNAQDAEDVLQNTFYKLYTCEKPFDDEIHVKNWLFFVALNEAKNIKKSRWNFWQELDENMIDPEKKDESELLEYIMKLPDKYRIVLTLHYYDGYSVAEIASLMQLKENTVLSQLKRGRDKLSKMLKGVYYEGLFI